VGLSWDQLPESLRQRVRAAEAAEPRTRKAGVRTPPVPYRCHDCGELIPWTTTQDSTPREVEKHQDRTGHARYEMVLDGPPSATVTPVSSPLLPTDQGAPSP
jgi:hypothetical protein